MPSSRNGHQRPWFGAKRIGWGLRPQTWQGWAITVGVVVAILGAAALAMH